MGSRKSQYIWVYQPQPPKFTAGEKARVLEEVKKIIQHLPKVLQKVSRAEMRANRIYLYELAEQIKAEGEYLEYPYARITLQDAQGDNCTVDWQRHNSRWVTPPQYSGTLPECIKNIENDACWF